METIINLKDIIDELITRLADVKSIYMFGSRAYNTGSARSDLDLIIYANSDVKHSTNLIRAFQRKYWFLDIFSGGPKQITSFINGASIRKKGLKSIIKQVDAIKIWDKKKKYTNTKYYHQTFIDGLKLLPSLAPYPSEVSQLKSLLNDNRMTADCAKFFHEATTDFINDSYNSSVSMIGCGCETILKQLDDALIKVYLKDNNSGSFLSDIDTKLFAKQRLIDTENYLVSLGNRLNRINISKNNINEYLNFFNIIRQYRNNADHPTLTNWNEGNVLCIISLVAIYLRKILDLIDKINQNYLLI